MIAVKPPAEPSTGHSILLIDDDSALATLMSEYFAGHGFQLNSALDGREGLGQALGGRYDLVILDATLPTLDGFEVLRQLRRRSDVPVIMLTARTHQQERIAGLEAGADDYLPKPFAFPELIARVKALARRPRSTPSPILKVGDVELDTIKRRVWRSAQPIDFSPKEIALLEFLMRHAGEVVSRTMIAEAVWDSSYNAFTNLIEVFINRIRRKIDQGRPAPLIQTVRGTGYTMRVPGDGTT